MPVEKRSHLQDDAELDPVMHATTAGRLKEALAHNADRHTRADGVDSGEPHAASAHRMRGLWSPTER
jgi:hypothetical protein